tara:strand:- start:466 stop:903 length:438 start_codon:yes stop_codon:yes gene_type:complete
MGFIESVKICFTKYSDFSGRASRSEFWYFTLFLVIYTIIIGLTVGVVFEIRYPGTSEADIDYFFDSFGFLVILPILLPSLSVTARRFHDFGHSGWIQIGFYFVMSILEIMNTTQGWVLYAIVLVSFYVYASQKPIGENKYGAVIH